MNVGDKVKICNGALRGQIGTITRIQGKNVFSIVVPSDPCPMMYRSYELAPLPKPDEDLQA